MKRTPRRRRCCATATSWRSFRPWLAAEAIDSRRVDYLTDGVIDPRALVERVMRESDGAYVLFEGVVRNHHEGKAVESIFYDAYRPMAEKEMETIVRDIESRYPQVALAVVHRLGHLVVGESSIAIVAASPHRREAFEACRMMID